VRKVGGWSVASVLVGVALVTALLVAGWLAWWSPAARSLPTTGAGFPVPQHVPGGVALAVEATLFPDCAAAPHAVPTIVLESEADGEQHTNTVESVPLAQWSPAVDEWCASGVHANLARSTRRPDGRATTTLLIINPGPGAIRIESPGARRGRARWWPAAVRVPPAASRDLVIRGIDTRHLDRPAPLVNGVPLTVCGEADGNAVQLC